MAGSSVILKNNLPLLNKAIVAAMSGGLEKAGQVAEVLMTQAIDRGIPPPLKESTILRKGSSLALFDTGEMYGQITHETADDGKSVKVGVIGSRASIAAIHEFGAPQQNIPERSFIRSVINSSEDRTKMNEEVIKTLRQAFKDSSIK